MQEGRNSVVEGVPENLPALQRAHRLQEKAAKVGFDWEKKSDVWKKVIEEIEEMHEIEQVKCQMLDVKSEVDEKLEGEVGDVFFALVNYARFLGINPENALRKTNRKFIDRFKFVEEKIKESGKSVPESSLPEMDKYWNESKSIFK